MRGEEKEKRRGRNWKGIVEGRGKEVERGIWLTQKFWRGAPYEEHPARSRLPRFRIYKSGPMRLRVHVGTDNGNYHNNLGTFPLH